MSIKPKSDFKDWCLHEIINGETPFALLILNQPINEENKEFIKKYWRKAIFRVAADGGAVQLKNLTTGEDVLVPDLICGDFDSVTEEILDFYRKKGTTIIHTPDQDETDFMKSVRLIVQYICEKQLQVSGIITVVRNGERLDHILGNLNTLYIAADLTTVPVLILGNNSITWLLSAGSHKIHVSKQMLDCHVGLIPLGKECTDVSSTGLQWNLDHSQMKFGGLISTCNRFDGSDTVTVTTDTPLIWTMEIDSHILNL